MNVACICSNPAAGGYCACSRLHDEAHQEWGGTYGPFLGHDSYSPQVLAHMFPSAYNCLGDAPGVTMASDSFMEWIQEDNVK